MARFELGLPAERQLNMDNFPFIKYNIMLILNYKKSEMRSYSLIRKSDRNEYIALKKKLMNSNVSFVLSSPVLQYVTGKRIML